MTPNVGPDEEEFVELMNAIIFYDGFDLAAWVTSVLNRTARRADVFVRWNATPLPVSLLMLKGEASAALLDAANAHLLVLALRQPEFLPPGLVDWLEQWAALRQVQDAALAVFDGGASNLFSATAPPALLRFVARHGLSFIPGHAQPAAGRLEGSLGDGRETVPLPIFTRNRAEPSTHPYLRCWGINE